MSFPTEIAGEGVRLFLAPELQLSAFYPGWSSGPWDAPGLFPWAYLRAGAEARLGPDLVLALSAALRTKPFQAGLSLDLPASAAAELHWYQEDGTVFSAYCLTEVGGPTSYAVYGGFGIGFFR